MRKLFMITASMLLAAGLCACTTERTVKTEVNFSTTNDGKTKSYSYTSDTTNGKTTVTESSGEETTAAEPSDVEINATEISEDGESGNDLDLRYYAENGQAYIITTVNTEGIEVGAVNLEDSTSVADAWVEDNVLTAVFDAEIEEGEAYAVIEVYEEGSDEAIKSIILPVYVKDGEIYDVAQEFSMVDTLDEYFSEQTE
ncbi:MAG: hypothetical protein J6I76_02750 [Oribacterium sp.]|nr:hypothetical protein [Oribacterium sp.]